MIDGQNFFDQPLKNYLRTYLETDSFYGHSMLQLLPTEILDLVNPKDFNLENYSNNSPMGCFLKTDLDYPDELHDLHNDFPLVREKNKSSKRNFVQISIKNHRK